MPLRIDNRKLDMFDGLRRYELLTTEQIAGGSKQWMRRILQALELAGHIRRPYGQRKTFKDKRNSWIYGLTSLSTT